MIISSINPAVCARNIAAMADPGILSRRHRECIECGGIWPTAVMSILGDF